MKLSKAILLASTLMALVAAPAMAQRSGGGGGRSGGSSHSSSSSSSHSSSSSRSGSSYSSSSRSGGSYSSSRSGSSYSSSSRHSSSPSSRSGSSYSSSSRHSSSPSSRSGSSYSSSSRHSSPSGRSGSSVASPSRGNSSRMAPSRGQARPAGTTAAPSSVRSGATGNAPVHSNTHSIPSQPRDYARAGRPGGHLPPAARPIRPAPYFHHPWHHHVVHCHPIYWDPLPPRAWYWPGFWHYCNSYWYDYHVTDVVVVRNYVQETYKVDLITYGISGDIMYAIVRDGGSTYLQVYDKNDRLLAEQKIHRKYCNMVIDSENGGCWISKKHEKDPLLFIWADGQLLIYEED